MPWGLIGMIGLMAGVERFVERGGMDFQDVGDWAGRAVVRAASRDAKRFDLLCFGDSQVKLGVIPRVIHERTGLTAYNLANSGGQAPASYFLLRRALDSGARPAAVIVNYQTTLLSHGPRCNQGKWSAQLNPGEAARLAYWARDPDFAARVTLGCLLPSVRCKDSVRANLLAALAGSPNDRRYGNFLLFRNWTKNDGAHLFATDPTLKDWTDVQIHILHRGFYREWTCHPANELAIDRFIELAAAHGIAVYWVLPPQLPRLEAALAGTDFEARHENFVRSRQARHPNLIVLDGRGRMKDLGGFYDAIHLSAEGANGFSRVLGNVIRATVPRGHGKPVLPASRWIGLAECRPVALPAGLEDTRQSEFAINHRGSVTR